MCWIFRKLVEGNVRPFLRASTALLLLSAAFPLTRPETADAQILVYSEFALTPEANHQQERATCGTAALDPINFLPTPAAADYSTFLASCSVTPSSGSVITSTQCPGGANGEVFQFPYGNPTGQCYMDFTPVPGVT